MNDLPGPGAAHKSFALSRASALCAPAGTSDGSFLATPGGVLLRHAAALSSDRSVAYSAAMKPQPEDSALMLRYQAGDAAAFDALYRRHNDALYRYLLRHCGQRAAAEDLYQEVWSRVIRARNRYRPTAKFTTYLYRIAHNCFIDYLRRNKHQHRDTHVDPDTTESQFAEPEHLAELTQARRRLDAALGQIPAEQRDAFLLHEEAGLSLEVIASICGTNRETVKSRLRYAQKKLRVALQSTTDGQHVVEARIAHGENRHE